MAQYFRSLNNHHFIQPNRWRLLTATLLFAFFCLTNCTSSKKVTRETKPKVEKPATDTRQPTPSVQTAVAQNEDFDPLLLKAPEFRIPRKQIMSKRDSSSVVALTQTPADTSWQTVPGYQVQLLQTEDAKQARATVREAILALNVEVETFYEAPHYKLRAGRFVNRYDAEQLQNLATEKGYVNCWVVRTQVKVRANELLNQK